MVERISRFQFLLRAAATSIGAAVMTRSAAMASSAERRYLALRMEGVSMLPTLWNGEMLKVDTTVYRRSAPRRGDIVVFHSPDFRPGFPALIKRVVGLPGEVVRIRDGNVSINGRRLSERYTHSRAGYFYPAHRVPPHAYFLLGDNRNNSEDSHLLGPIARREIIGKVIRR